MGMFADSGLITRGFGKDNKIVTRGMGTRSALGGGRGVIQTWRHGEYIIGLVSPIGREENIEIELSIPIQIINHKNISIKSKVIKGAIKLLNFIIPVNSSKLFEIIDEI